MENLKEPSNHRLYCRKRSKGFSLMEVIIACFILMLGITGVFFAINQILRHMSVYPSELIAAYLAQEGIEITRNIRDTNWLEDSSGAPVPWNDGLLSGPWQADYNDAYLDTYNDFPVDGEKLKVDTYGFYNYSLVGDPTNFSRKITIMPGASTISCVLTQLDDCFLVIVTVYWREKGLLRQVTAQETLYRWH